MYLLQTTVSSRTRCWCELCSPLQAICAAPDSDLLQMCVSGVPGGFSVIREPRASQNIELAEEVSIMQWRPHSMFHREAGVLRVWYGHHTLLHSVKKTNWLRIGGKRGSRHVVWDQELCGSRIVAKWWYCAWKLIRRYERGSEFARVQWGST